MAARLGARIKAFSSVEVLLSIALFSLLVTALAGALIYSLQANQVVSYKNKASFLADEGQQALRNIRDNSFAALVDGTYGLAISGGRWVLSGTSDASEDFTRQVVISTIDSNTKQVKVDVNWPTKYGAEGKVSLTSQLTNWLRVVASQWSSVSLLGSLDLTGSFAGLKVTYQGDYAYVIRSSTSANAFAVVNISNPAAPTATGYLNLNGTPTDVIISGIYAYVTTTNDTREVQIINISNPISPSIVANVDLAGGADGRSLAFIGSNIVVVRAFTSGTTPELYIVNPNIIGIPIPLTLGSVNWTAGNATDVVVIGDYAYVSTDNANGEVVAINVSNVLAPALTGTLNLTGSLVTTAITGYGSTLLVGASNSNSMFVVNASNPAVMTSTITFAGTVPISDIKVNAANTVAFVTSTTASKAFFSLNISNPASIAQLGSYTATAGLSGLTYDTGRNRIYAVGLATNAELLILGTT